MQIYLDMCSFNRPYDDQSNLTVKLEAEAKLFVQQKIKQGKFELAWSYMLDLENEENPYRERRETIEKWANLAFLDVEPCDAILKHAELLEKKGVKPEDALHIGCAVFAKCQYFITTDYKLIKKTSNLKQIQVLNPLDFVRIAKE